MKVPAGKIVYIKRRKYVEGDELPGNVMFSMPEMTKKEADNIVNEPVKKRGRKPKEEIEQDVISDDMPIFDDL